MKYSEWMGDFIIRTYVRLPENATTDEVFDALKQATLEKIYHPDELKEDLRIDIDSIEQIDWNLDKDGNHYDVSNW